MLADIVFSTNTTWHLITNKDLSDHSLNSHNNFLHQSYYWLLSVTFIAGIGCIYSKRRCLVLSPQMMFKRDCSCISRPRMFTIFVCACKFQMGISDVELFKCPYDNHYKRYDNRNHKDIYGDMSLMCCSFSFSSSNIKSMSSKVSGSQISKSAIN